MPLVRGEAPLASDVGARDVSWPWILGGGQPFGVGHCRSRRNARHAHRLRDYSCRSFGAGVWNVGRGDRASIAGSANVPERPRSDGLHGHDSFDLRASSSHARGSRPRSSVGVVCGYPGGCAHDHWVHRAGRGQWGWGGASASGRAFAVGGAGAARGSFGVVSWV